MAYDSQRFRREAHRRFGIDRFRPGQEEILRAIMEGRDVLGIMPTAGGKSLCFQLPSLFLPGATVVISPLISLMQDQQEKLARMAIDAAKLNSTLSRSEERETAEEIAEGETKLVYATPERMENPEALELLGSQGVSLFVVDEAHCISQWGHDFRPAYLSLRDAVQKLGRPPILALTATATTEVAEDIVRQLRMEKPVVINTGVHRPNLSWEVVRTVNSGEKREKLLEILRSEPGSGIVYAATVRIVNELWSTLRGAGIEAGRYHGKMPVREREEMQQRFMRGEIPVIIATSAFGLGVDKPDIRYVVHYTFPDSVETYYQEAGRAGRDGNPARAVLLFRLEDRRIQAFFLGGKYPRRDETLHVWRYVEAVRAVSVKALAEKAGLSEKKVRVVVAQLEGARIVRRTGRGVLRVGELGDTEKAEALLSAYEERHGSDRERLETMMRYAASTRCRTRFIHDYFEEPGESECGHCDNCKGGRNARHLASPFPLPPLTADTKGATADWQAGDTVTHRRFGGGVVVEPAGENLLVDFEKAGRKKVRASYVKRTVGRT